MLNPKQVPPHTQYPYSTNRKGSDMQSTTNWNKKYIFFKRISWKTNEEKGETKQRWVKLSFFLFILTFTSE